MNSSLHYEAFGPSDGTPVLALHGWTPDHRLMTGCCEPVFAERPGSYRRIYPDLPGMGQSPAGGVNGSDDMMQALGAFIDDHIGDRPFLLIGESYGGYLARAIAACRPDQVLGLALICPIGVAVENSERDVPPHQVIVAEIEDLDPDSEFGQNAVVQTPEIYERAQQEIASGMEDADQDALDRIRQNWQLSEQPESGPAYDRPTLMVTGRQDSSVGYRDVWALLEHYPRATFAVLDAAGHNAQLERPEVLATMLNDWMDRAEYDARSAKASA